MTDRWSDYFTVLSSRKVRANGGWKTNKADETTCQVYCERCLLLLVTTVRLTSSNLAHFCVNSGARIGENGWNLKIPITSGRESMLHAQAQGCPLRYRRLSFAGPFSGKMKSVGVQRRSTALIREFGA